MQSLINGKVTFDFSSKVEMTTSSLQQFIDGKANAGVAIMLGLNIPAAQELRNIIGREGAIGIIIGLYINKINNGKTEHAHQYQKKDNSSLVLI